MIAKQLPLQLPHRAAEGREDFLVAEANQGAVDWIDRWPDWPGPTLMLHGPAGSGKSHLLAVWRDRASAKVLNAISLRTDGLDAVVGDALAVAVDDADQCVDAEALLHLHNMMRDRDGRLLLTSRTAPGRWTLGPADLRSRLAGAPVGELREPDDALLGAVMMKLFSDRQLRIAPEVLSYMLIRMPRSFAAAREIVASLDAAALARRKPITTALARDVLATHDLDSGEGEG